MRGWLTGAAIAVGLASSACSGGGGDGSGGSTGGSGVPGVEASRTCAGACPQQALSVAQVQRIISQAVAQVQAAGALPAVIAVVDRVGNVLAVFKMNGAQNNTTITTQRGVSTGLENFSVPSWLAAISKAGTAAYLSSQGNAFTTRTASQIVQQNFNPGVTDQPGGPLFGVQFSQLPCGDLVKTFGAAALEGPKRLPLGFAADPGGLPLYIEGVPVGGVGIELNGIYTADPDVQDIDSSVEERVATAATAGFEAPQDRRADRISVGGLTLRFSDDENTSGASVPPFGALPGALIPVPGFAAATVTAGATFLTNASGVVSTSFDGLSAEILVNTAGAPRFPPTDSTTPTTGAGGLTANEVRVVLREALAVAAHSRAQIRRPLNSAARVSVSVVDLSGNVLGLVRAQDAPVFGIDVSLQKARSVALFGQTTSAASFAAAPDLGAVLGIPGVFGTQPFSQYVANLATFSGGQLTLANGVAFGDRSIGNLARPFFPDGINANTNGPLSKPFPQWSPFSTGLQLEASFTQLATVLCQAAGTQVVTPLGITLAQLFLNQLGVDCTTLPAPTSCTAASLSTIRNGLQIFAGSVPIFRGATLIGAIGVSGDGIDQDDLVSFLGLHNAGVALGGAIGNAPLGIRTDTVSIGGGQLRYVNCPVAPFLDSSDQTPCLGK
jgi:uncharacterized protein GlcG (DUF336 family)